MSKFMQKIKVFYTNHEYLNNAKFCIVSDTIRGSTKKINKKYKNFETLTSSFMFNVLHCIKKREKKLIKENFEYSLLFFVI